MCINLYTLPKRSIAMLSWNVLTISRQLLVTQLRFRYMFLSASWEHLDSFVRLLLTILDELFLVVNMFHEFSKVHGPSDRSRIVKKCQVVSRIGYRSRQEVSRHAIRHISCSNSYSGTGPLVPLGIRSCCPDWTSDFHTGGPRFEPLPARQLRPWARRLNPIA